MAKMTYQPKKRQRAKVRSNAALYSYNRLIKGTRGINQEE